MREYLRDLLAQTDLRRSTHLFRQVSSIKILSYLLSKLLVIRTQIIENLNLHNNEGNRIASGKMSFYVLLPRVVDYFVVVTWEVYKLMGVKWVGIYLLADSWKSTVQKSLKHIGMVMARQILCFLHSILCPLYFDLTASIPLHIYNHIKPQVSGLLVSPSSFGQCFQ